MTADEDRKLRLREWFKGYTKDKERFTFYTAEGFKQKLRLILAAKQSNYNEWLMEKITADYRKMFFRWRGLRYE